MLLLDAGPDTVFGPVAIAAVPASGFGAAKLVYSAGDGGQYGVMVQTLANDGSPVGAPTLVAATNLIVYQQDAGPIDLVYAESPPAVAVADDGQQTAVCWEDLGQSTNLDAGCPASEPSGLVLCAALADSDGDLDASYSNCGGSPQLVFSPTDGITELFLVEHSYGIGPNLVNWVFGQGWDTARTLTSQLEGPVAVPLPSGGGAAVYTLLDPSTSGTASGLYLSQVDFSSGTFFSDQITEIDSAYQSYDQVQDAVAAASSQSASVVGVLEFENGVLSELAWDVDAGTGSSPVVIPSAPPLVGAIAAGACPNAFGYLAATEHDTVLFVEATFDGRLLPATTKFVDLQSFNQTPGLVRLNNNGWVVPSTSLAVAPAPGGNLFLAISNPAQIAVYFVSCE